MNTAPALPAPSAEILVPIADHWEDWQRLKRVLRALEESSGFHFLIISCRNQLYRDSLLSLLAPLHPHNRVQSLRLWKDEDPGLLFAHLKQLAATYHPIHLVDSDAYFPEFSPTDLARIKDVLGLWNRARNGLAAGCTVPIILWANESLIDAIALHAPDLWAWRHSVYQFDLPVFDARNRSDLTPIPQRAVEERFDLLPSEIRQQRLKEMLENLEEEKLPSLSRAYLTLEAARHSWILGEGDLSYELVEKALMLAIELKNDIFLLISSLELKADILELRGQMDEALQIRTEQLIPMLQQLGDARSEAVTHGKIADILQSRGQLEKALRIRTEKQLPVSQMLGDIREEAVTLGKIADILYERGQLDEALRIRKEIQLPVFKKIGDIRSLALTHVKIADILQARGLLDEALRIRTERQLTIFQKLGDIRSEALTYGQIADILFQRGQLDEALRIHTEKELPVYRKLGDIREESVCLAHIAQIHIARLHATADLQLAQQECDIAITNLAKAWSIAHTMQIPEQLQFEQLAASIGVTPAQLATAATDLPLDSNTEKNNTTN